MMGSAWLHLTEWQTEHSTGSPAPPVLVLVLLVAAFPMVPVAALVVVWPVARAAVVWPAEVRFGSSDGRPPAEPPAEPPSRARTYAARTAAAVSVDGWSSTGLNATTAAVASSARAM